MRISDWSSDVCSSDLAYAKPVKGSRVLERQFHALAQLVASFVDAADVVPADIRHLHHDFAHGRWLDPFVGSDEIIPPHRKILQNFRRDGPFLQIQLGDRKSTRLNSSH